MEGLNKLHLGIWGRKIGNPVLISLLNTGTKFIDISFRNYNTMIQMFPLANIEIYIDNTLHSTIVPSESIRITGLNQDTSYVIETKLISTGIELPSNIISATTASIVYYKMDETTGSVIDSYNGINGTLVGSATRDGTWYTYGPSRGSVNIPDNDLFSFVDTNGNNMDFTISTVFKIDDVTSRNMAWLVSKRQQNRGGVSEWQMIYYLGQLVFVIYNTSYHELQVIGPVIGPVYGKLYQLSVSHRKGVMYLFLNGVLETTTNVPTGFQFFNGPSIIQLGDSAFASGLHLIGRQNNTAIIKGYGWDESDAIDAWNNGNPLDF